MSANNIPHCPEHPYAGAICKIEPDTSPHYARGECPKCGRFLTWYKTPPGVTKKRRPVVVGGVAFDTKSALTEYVKGVLADADPDTKLDGTEYTIIRELVDYHPEAENKIGTGISRIEVRNNYEFGNGARGFWLIRNDGSETDFSYRKCLSGNKASNTKFIAACRYAIKPHVEDFKREFFDVATSPTCALTGQPLSLDTCHVDHVPPCTFERIVDGFAAVYGIDPSDPNLCINGVDGLMVPLLASELIRDRFVQFHNSFARLRVISAQANLTLVPASVR